MISVGPRPNNYYITRLVIVQPQTPLGSRGLRISDVLSIYWKTKYGVTDL